VGDGAETACLKSSDASAKNFAQLAYSEERWKKKIALGLKETCGKRISYKGYTDDIHKFHYN
jgi:hypothetical protein